MEIDVGDLINAVTFSANGEHLLSGRDGVQVWRVEDGEQTTTLDAAYVRRLAVSSDNRWIAAGTISGWVLMWDAGTHEQVLQHWEDNWDIFGVDFSPDSTRFLSASDNRTAIVWDVLTRKQLQTLRHDGWLRAAKYSPRGDRIATATYASVRVWDSDGALLVHIEAAVAALYNSSLLWFDDDLFVISDNKIKQFDASTGSALSEWHVPNSNEDSCIALPQHGEFIAYSTDNTVTFWDTSTHIQLAVIQHPQHIYSIAFSPDGRLFAIGGLGGKILVEDIHDGLPLSYSAAPFVNIADTTLDLLTQDRLTEAETSLTSILLSDSVLQIRSNHAFANRAIIRSRLHLWNLAIDDAETSIRIRSSVVGYIAKSVALVGSGQKEDGCRMFDLAFRRCHPAHLDHLLLIKAVVIFMAGKHNDAISRVDDLIATGNLHPTSCYLVQAYMYLFLGKAFMESGNYMDAIHYLERAQACSRYRTGNRLLAIFLISGWKFDDLGIMVRRHLSEALYAAGRTVDAGETLLELVNTFEAEIRMSRALAEWVFDFVCQCLSTAAFDGDVVSEEIAAPIPLLREWAKAALTSRSWKDALLIAAQFVVPRTMIYRVICEHLETLNCITDAMECFHQMDNEFVRETNMYKERAKWEWAADFKHSCTTKLESFGDKAVDAEQYDDAIAQYSAALLLCSAAAQDIFVKRSKAYVAKGLWKEALDDMNQSAALGSLSRWNHEIVLKEWARVRLTDGSWQQALTMTEDFNVPKFTIYQVLCEHLETTDCVMNAVGCFHEMMHRFGREVSDKREAWILGFRSRCRENLENLGDYAMDTQQYCEAISQYSTALSLNPTLPQGLLVKRSKAYMANDSLEAALNDANEVIELDPMSPWGYERRHAALHKVGDYVNAINAFDVMLSKMSQSSDPQIRECRLQYINPEKVKKVVQVAVQDAIRDSPRMLIDTTSGRFLDKSEQASAFESLPVFNKMISSMIIHIDHSQIKQNVAQYYRYAMFSHKWEDNEPLFEKVAHTIIYELENSPTNDKLRRFCEIVRDAGLHWAWSDTCCINKADHFVLQEALVAMFKWYHGSSLTVVYLRDAPLRRLVDSIWNSRAWTFQEYHASKVVRFYNEDWTPYLNLDIPNYKESPEIILEMEEVTGIPAQALMELRPGLGHIRKKLCLASTRQTALVEDAAYSLLGIFSMSLPIVYGEGDQALGRLLAQLLTNSGDTSILAWTGMSGSFNSCLPSSISVFSQLPSSHVPRAITGPEMGMFVTRLRTSPLDLTSITKFYDRLDELPVPLFAGKRMKLPCITFKLGALSVSRSGSQQLFRAQTTALGVVEIRTQEDLSQFSPLYLVHPWIDFLLDRQPIGSVIETISEGNTDNQVSTVSQLTSLPGFSASTIASTGPQSRTAQLASRFGLPFGRSATRRRQTMSLQLPSDARSFTDSLRPPSSLAASDKEALALRTLARLRQPFGALLLTPDVGNVAAYRRVASESLMVVKVQEITPAMLDKLVDWVRVLDVL